jgi:P-type E1-E2 ATPase
LISVITQFAFLLGVILTTDQALFSNETLLKIGKIAIVAVVIMIVAIPEGLPLAVSIAMALSINSLKKDAILIKNLESVQTCAMLHDICVGKTGTLTKGNLSVTKFQLGNNHEVHSNDPERVPATYFNSKQFDCAEDMKDIIRESIFANTDARIEIDDKEYKYVPMGSAIEVGMIQFLMDNEEDVQQKMIDRNMFSPKIV